MKLIRFKFKSKEMLTEYTTRFRRHIWAVGFSANTVFIARINKRGQVKSVFDGKTLKELVSSKEGWLPFASFEFEKFCEKVD